MSTDRIIWYIGAVVWFIAGIMAIFQSNYFAMIPCFWVSVLSIRNGKE